MSPMIYLDNAATTWPKPPGVAEEVMRAITEYGGNPGRSSHLLSLRAAEKVEEAREAIAALIAAEHPENIIFTQNATYALNLAIKTRVRRGTHILISDREHNAVYRPLCRLMRDGIADFDVFSTRGDVCRNILSLCRKNTDMLVCNHVSNVDGTRQPVEAIGRLCREKGIYFIVDASQSLGHLPLSLTEIPADALCAPGHKGLFGIQGSGFAYLRSGNGLREFMEGGSGSASLSPEMPQELPERMEAGTLQTPAIASLLAGVAFVRRLTPDAIAEKEAALSARLCARLDAMHGVDIYHGGGGVVSFTARTLSPGRIGTLLDRKNICVRSGLHCAPLAHAAIGTQRTGSVRVSFSWFNTEKEVDRFADALRDILENEKEAPV